VACDLPLLDADTLALLAAARDAAADATAFFSPYIEGPDPLAAIWEPSALALLAEGRYKGPFKTLKAARVNLVQLADASVLANANTPEARAAAQARLKKP
jgi:molybdopterin-guanine dinucleotide biosynthesis protein A